MSTHFVRELDEPRVVYKVALPESENLFRSVCAMKHAGITYELNQEIAPTVEKTPIFTFKTSKAAFLWKPPKAVVLECMTLALYGIQMKRILQTTELETISPRILYDFWSVPLEREKFRHKKTVLSDKNTLLVSSLIPLRVVESRELFEEKEGSLYAGRPYILQ